MTGFDLQTLVSLDHSFQNEVTRKRQKEILRNAQQCRTGTGQRLEASLVVAEDTLQSLLSIAGNDAAKN